jgi:hypothetical protein
VYMWTNINQSNSLSTHADAVSKNQYPHMRIRVAI